MASTLREGEEGQKLDFIGRNRCGVSECCGRPIVYFFIFCFVFFFYQRKMNLDHDQTSVPEQFPRGELPPSLG